VVREKACPTLSIGKKARWRAAKEEEAHDRRSRLWGEKRGTEQERVSKKDSCRVVAERRARDAKKKDAQANEAKKKRRGREKKALGQISVCRKAEIGKKRLIRLLLGKENKRKKKKKSDARSYRVQRSSRESEDGEGRRVFSSLGKKIPSRLKKKNCSDTKNCCR